MEPEENEYQANFVRQNIKTIVLARISEEPINGSGIVKYLDEQFGYDANTGNMYRTLHRLKDEGFIRIRERKRRENVGGRDSIVYEVTDEGTKELETYMEGLTSFFEKMSEMID